MRLAIYDDYRLGVVDPDAGVVTRATSSPEPHDPDPLGAGWWVRLCRDVANGDPVTEMGEPCPLDTVSLRAPVLNPGKVIACASNYAAHVAEMRDHVLPGAGVTGDAWLLDFDVFLKAPSSIVGPRDRIVLPEQVVRDGNEIHHEGELAVVIGRGGRHVDERDALDHVFGYTIALDITVRGTGDRSRRKSYPSFTPVGPWVTTRDEAGDWRELGIELSVNGTVRQRVGCADMLVSVPGIVAYASRAMTLEPGDVILTGAPPGVGPISAGDVVDVSVSGLGSMRLPVVPE